MVDLVWFISDIQWTLWSIHGKLKWFILHSYSFLWVIHCRLTLKCVESKWGSMPGKGKWGQSECIHSIHSLEERVHLICKTSPGLYAVCMNISFLFNIYLNLLAVNEFIYANIVCIDSLHSFVTCFVNPVFMVLHSCDCDWIHSSIRHVFVHECKFPSLRTFPLTD